MRGESRAICRLIVLSSLDGLIKFYINCHMTKFPKWAVIALNKSVRGHFWMHSCNNDRLTYETGDHENKAVVKAQFLSDPGPIIVYPCQWLTDSLTD